MTTQDVRVDGNAAAGVLGELFAIEMTMTRVTCDGCGGIEALGALPAYMQAPGIILRCPACDTPLIRLVRGHGRYWVDLRGARCLEFGQSEPFSGQRDTQ